MTLELPERPILKRHLLARTVDERDVFVVAENRAWIWSNPGLVDLLEHLDGQRTLGELIASLGSRLSPPAIVHLLRRLNQRGLLADGATASPRQTDAELAYWSALGPADEGARRTAQAVVRVRTLGPALGPMTEALADAGITTTADPHAEVTLDVVVTDHYLHGGLAGVNDGALIAGMPWLICIPDGRTLWIGPLFRPGRTACLVCLQERLRLNRVVPDFLVRRTGDTEHYRPSVAAHPAGARLGAAWTAHEVAAWIGGRTDRLESRLLSVEMGANGPEVTEHTVVRRPQCPACGSTTGDGRYATPVVLEPASTSVVGTRTRSPGEILQALEHHISPITGIVTGLSPIIDDPDGLIHVYSARQHIALGPDTVRWLRMSAQSRTMGKGATPEEAKVSALAEAIERYCGVFHADTLRTRSTYRALGDQAVHPQTCLNFSDTQYDWRDELNRHSGFSGLVPRRFPEDLELDWVPLWSMTEERTRFLPAAFCYLGHPDVKTHFYCAGEPNGCAAGSTLPEAIVTAFLELVERDSVALWWYNRAPRPAVDLASADDPYVLRVHDHYTRHGRELWALDLTTDLGIPAIVCVSRRVDGPSEDLLVGFGAHLDARAALRHAVTEVNQFLPAVSRRAADGQTIYAWPDEEGPRFWSRESLAAQPHLAPAATLPPRTLAEFPRWPPCDPSEALRTCLDLTRRLGMDMLVLDQSRPDVELTVARVVVPGLRHFWPRLGPGRLYDVPVRLGWLPAPRMETELNPSSIFF